MIQIRIRSHQTSHYWRKYSAWFFWTRWIDSSSDILVISSTIFYLLYCNDATKVLTRLTTESPTGSSLLTLLSTSSEICWLSKMNIDNANISSYSSCQTLILVLLFGVHIHKSHSSSSAKDFQRFKQWTFASESSFDDSCWIKIVIDSQFACKKRNW
jgi:hypothetical protein